MIYEVLLRGFDPKEDEIDGSTTEYVFVSTNKTNPRNIIEEAINNGRLWIKWNPDLCEITRTVGSKVRGYVSKEDILKILRKWSCVIDWTQDLDSITGIPKDKLESVAIELSDYVNELSK